MPKVSVLTPIYNTPLPHLKEAIDSILSQTFSDFEYLILNDSPDNTELDEFIASYDDARIRYIKNPQNIGLEASTNKLLKMARGEYVAIFDHDDISLPERLEKEAAYLDKHPKVGVVSAQFQVFGIQNWTSKNPLSSAAIKRRLRTESCVSHTTAMFRKAVLDKHKIKYEKRFFPAASYRIITRLALVTELHNLPDVLLRYRMDGENTSIRHAAKRVVARDKLRLEYVDKYKEQRVTEEFQLDNIVSLGSGHHLDERRYYKAFRGNETFFIKVTDTAHDVEFKFAKKAYEEDPSHFIEPVATYEGDINCYVSRWNKDVVDLDVYMKDVTLTATQKKTFLQDLADIYKVLWQKKIVHRDIIPRNFVVVDGHLKLIDFYWAVYFDDYREYDFIEEEMRTISGLGEAFALGPFKWDDAYSFKKVAQYIIGEDDLKKYPVIEDIAKKIGDRVIEPKPAVLGKNIIKLNDIIQELGMHNNKQHELITHLQEHNQKQHKVILEQNEHIKKISETLNSIIGSKSYRSIEKVRKVKHLLKKSGNKQ